MGDREVVGGRVEAQKKIATLNKSPNPKIFVCGCSEGISTKPRPVEKELVGAMISNLEVFETISTAHHLIMHGREDLQGSQGGAL